MRAGLNRLAVARLRQHRTRGRLHRHRPQRCFAFVFKITRNTSDRAARTHTRNQNIHFTAGRIPNFRTGGRYVNRRIGRIFELLQQHIFIGIGCGDFLRFRNRAFHALCALGQHQFCTIGREQFASLHAHGVRHGQGNRNTARRRRKSQGDAGVTAGRLDQLFACRQDTALLRIPNHRRTDTALDRIGRIAPLNFGQNRGLRALLLGNAVDAHQRRLTNRLRVVCKNLCHVSSPEIILKYPKAALSHRHAEPKNCLSDTLY